MKNAILELLRRCGITDPTIFLLSVQTTRTSSPIFSSREEIDERFKKLRFV